MRSLPLSRGLVAALPALLVAYSPVAWSAARKKAPPAATAPAKAPEKTPDAPGDPASAKPDEKPAADAAAPAKPVDPAAPAKADAKPADPAAPAKADAKPADPAAPAKAEAKPADPATPAKPEEKPAEAAAKPADKPADAPAEAPEENVKRVPRNRSLEYAKELVKQGRGDEAMKELETAASLKGNTPEISLGIAATRVQALLLQTKPSEFAARELAIEVLHQDPEGVLFKEAPEVVQALLANIRAEQVFVLHDRMAVTKPGLPVKLKARVADPKGEVAGLTLHYKGHSVGGWSAEAMRKDAQGFSGLIRDPGALAPAGVTDDFTIDYFVTAEDAGGKRLDQYGSDEMPVSMVVSSTKIDESRKLDLTAFDLHDKPAEAVAPVVAPKPWYLETYALVGGGVVLVGITAAIVYAVVHEKPLDPHIGILNLP